MSVPDATGSIAEDFACTRRQRKNEGLQFDRRLYVGVQISTVSSALPDTAKIPSLLSARELTSLELADLHPDFSPIPARNNSPLNIHWTG
jgi:hypothetical protein